MKKNCSLILVFQLCCLTFFAQKNDFLTGKIFEANSNLALQGVNIFNQTSNIGNSSKSDGSFQIQIKQYPTTLIFSYIGYENVLLEITDISTKPISVQMERSTFGLPEVEITDQPKIKKLTKDTYTVKDFILDGENILLLTYNGFRANNKLRLTDWDGKLLSEIEIEKINVDKFHRSCLGNIHLIGKTVGYEVSLVGNTIQIISKYPSRQFKKLIEPCVETSTDFLYRQDYQLNNQLLNYNIISKKEKIVISKIYVIDRKNLSRSKDDFQLRLQFGPSFPRPLSWEQRRAWQSLVYKPLFSPLHNLGEELCLFNHTLGYLEFYTFEGKNKRIVPITYHENKKWEKLILKDEEYNKVYTVYDKRKGKMIYEINLINGKVIPALYFESSLIEKMVIHRGHLFYLESGPTISEKNRVLHRVELDQ
ncbi:MAG: carboxypeptidase-like regulatory domain-containing protein [Saprospiraceae bacterium]